MVRPIRPVSCLTRPRCVDCVAEQCDAALDSSSSSLGAAVAAAAAAASLHRRGVIVTTEAASCQRSKVVAIYSHPPVRR